MHISNEDTMRDIDGSTNVESDQTTYGNINVDICEQIAEWPAKFNVSSAALS